MSLGKRNIYNPTSFDIFQDVSLISASYYTFGPWTFNVEEEWATTTTTTGLIQIPLTSNSPWGCAVCSCCMEKCEQRRAYQTDPNRATLVKQCQADHCYSHFGMQYCMSTNGGKPVTPTTSTFNPLSGCATCRCCKDKCAVEYDGNQPEKKACKDNFCRAHFGIDICRDHSNFNPTTGTTISTTPTTVTTATSFDPLVGCFTCRCCKDKCAAKYDDQVEKKACKDDFCRAHFGIDTCRDNSNLNPTATTTPITTTPTTTTSSFNPLSGCSSCRCCKDKCATKYGDNDDKKKDCKTDICRAHFGRDKCNDSNNTGVAVSHTGTTFNPLDGCSSCRCCKDNCEDKYTGDKRKDCKTDICRAFYGKDPCVDGTSNTSTGVTSTKYDPFGCTNCRCCKDNCAEIHDGDDDKKECKTRICREYHGRDACDD